MNLKIREYENRLELISRTQGSEFESQVKILQG